MSDYAPPPDGAAAQDVADLILAWDLDPRVLQQAAGIVLGEATRRAMIAALAKPGDELWRRQ